MLLLGAASLCLFEASPAIGEYLKISHRWIDALSVILFFGGAFAAVCLDEFLKRSRDAEIR